MAVTLVERAEELERLDHFLAQALAGKGQLCFVRGEGGAGKTTLLTAFSEQALGVHDELVVATGMCDAQTGIGDAFLPFREILELLTGNVDSKLAQGRITDENAGRLRRMFSMCTEAIVELGPDLIGSIVPGATFVAALGMFVASKTPWAEKLQGRLEKVGKVGGEKIDQNQIFEQYLKVLEALSTKTPLVLIIDDLQWADTASVGLLFRLGRRIEESRILVIGLYRPSDVALGRAGDRHPLEALINEMKRYYGEIEIDLDRSGQKGRNFVDSFLDLEGNDLSESFRKALHQKTGGHALFTVELLRALQERGDLVRDATGKWIEGPSLDWNDTPSRVEGVIEERLDRLDDELRRSLTIAAVEGENFTAEVVSHVQPAEMRKLVTQLSDTLQKRHQLVTALGVDRLGDQRLSRYRFSHNLMQSYLLNNLDDVEASFLHEDVGKALEDLHQVAPEAIAVQLARHFDIAGVAQKAQQYLALAGDRAMEVYANHEALTHYTRALDWATDDRDRFRVLLSRLKVHELSGDQAARRSDLEALEELAMKLKDPASQAEATLQRCKIETATGNYTEARKAGDDAAALFNEVGDAAGEASTRLSLSLLLYQSANYAEARAEASQALAQAREIGRHDLEGGCLANLGIIADLSGDRQESRTRFEEALAVYKRANFPTNEAKLLSNLGVAYWRVHDLESATDYFQQALTKSRQVGARVTEGVSLSNLAMVWRSKGDLDQARRYIEEGLLVNRQVASPYAISRTLGILASILLDQGDYPAARAIEEEALSIDRKAGDRQDMGYRLASLGRLARRLGEHERSRSHYDEALVVCREIGDRDVEAMCIRGLTALHLDLGQPAKALELANQALDLSKELEDHEGQALAALLAGHARMAIDDIDGAERAYVYARDLEVSSVAPSTAAGLAHVAMRRNDRPLAAALIEPIVDRLLARDTAGMEEIFRLYATTHGVLEETDDERADEVLRVGRATLAEYAARLPDETARKSFLEGVTINRILGS